MGTQRKNKLDIPARRSRREEEGEKAFKALPKARIYACVGQVMKDAEKP